MDLYTFVVESFVIHDTRAAHNDTLTLSHSAFVDGDMVAYRTLHMGDFDNGEYSPADYAPDNGGLNGVVINDPTAKTAFIFQLVNAGNVPDGSLTGRLAATADQLAGITAGLAGAGAADAGAAVSSPFFAGGLILEAFATLWSWLDADCDGPVAADQISGPRYWLDARTDNSSQTIRFTQNYPGTDSPTGCGGNSNYDVTWSLRHWRDWVAVADPDAGPFTAAGGVSAVEHNGAVHAFGTVDGGGVTHANSLTGATWSLDSVGSFDLADQPVSAVSFDDRLYVFGVHTDSSISALAYTVDGGSWVELTAAPPALGTAQPVAAAVFRNRLHLFARDEAAGALRTTSTADLEEWNAWTDVPNSGLAPDSPVAAVALHGTLHLFGVFKTGKKPAAVVVHNSTANGQTWTGWDMIEAGLGPQGQPGTAPVDVAATTFRDRLYIASRWELVDGGQEPFVAVNFSGDGDNWSGWRVPQAAVDARAAATAGVAAVHDHLYVLAPLYLATSADITQVWAY